MSYNVGPIMTFGGYDQIRCLMRYESHGMVDVTAIYAQSAYQLDIGVISAYRDEEDDFI